MRNDIKILIFLKYIFRLKKFYSSKTGLNCTNVARSPFNYDDAITTGKKIVAASLISKKSNAGKRMGGNKTEFYPAGIIKLVTEKISSREGAVNRRRGFLRRATRMRESYK